MKLTHAELCALAVAWLRRKRVDGHRPQGYGWLNGGPGCSVAGSELSVGAEEPDALGFDTRGNSHMVECKISRTDFLRDKHKPGRHRPLDENQGWLGGTPGMAHYRWYLSERFIIEPDDLPTGWGLIHVLGRKQVRMVVEAQRQAEVHPYRALAALVRITRVMRGACTHSGTLGLGRSLYSVDPFTHDCGGAKPAPESLVQG